MRGTAKIHTLGTWTPSETLQTNKEHKCKLVFVSAFQRVSASLPSSEKLLSTIKRNWSFFRQFITHITQDAMSAVGTATFFGGLLLAKLINYASRSSTSPSIPISIALLHDQDSNTSTAIISNFASSSDFIKLSKFEGDQISSRDSEDSTKLDEGIAIARAKSAIPSNYTPEPYTKIDVLGKSASFVANEMLSSIPLEKSFVLVLCGLSGTGKGTTVAQLKSVLTQKHGKKVTTWSNGNIFRSVTYLAAMYCLKNGKKDFDASFCLTPKLLKGFLGMLSFGQINGKFDIKVESKELGVSMLVGDVCNTVLKEPIVAKNIPTVAQVTQGEVIR